MVYNGFNTRGIPIMHHYECSVSGGYFSKTFHSSRMERITLWAAILQRRFQKQRSKFHGFGNLIYKQLKLCKNLASLFECFFGSPILFAGSDVRRSVRFADEEPKRPHLNLTWVQCQTSKNNTARHYPATQTHKLAVLNGNEAPFCISSSTNFLLLPTSMLLKEWTRSFKRVRRNERVDVMSKMSMRCVAETSTQISMLTS